MSIEEFISKWGKQHDGGTGLQKAIAEKKTEIKNQMLEDIMAEVTRKETNK